MVTCFFAFEMNAVLFLDFGWLGFSEQRAKGYLLEIFLVESTARREQSANL
jgi:hypothetical protein